jgi:outer membrane protein assembly factor BamD
MSIITIKNAAFSLLLCLLVFACKKKPEPTADALLEKGLKNAKEQKYESCIYNLGKIDEIAPYSTHSKTSTPVLIYCNYMQGNYENIQTMIDNFESVYPNNEQLPYVYYLRGLSHFRMIKNHKKSLQNIDNLLTVITRLNEIAPESKYTENLNKIIPFILELQDKHTLYIAQSYVKTQNFIAAMSRYSTLYEGTLTDETKKIIANSMEGVLGNLGIHE